MRWRVYIGVPDPPAYADWTDQEFGGDLHRLAAACAWKLPLRIFGKDQQRIDTLVRILGEDYSMDEEDIGYIEGRS